MMIPPYTPHFDVWAVVAILAIGYWYAERRLRPLLAPASPAATAGQWRLWYAGVIVMLVASDWPIHDLAEETLFTAHMIEHMLVGYVVPPLLLAGVPRWMADATLGHRRVAPWLKPLASPVVGFFAFNVVMVGLHWPVAIEWQNSSEPAHFAMHVLLFLTAVLMWMPVFSPTPALPRLGEPMQMLYLFLNTIIPTVPASFITFSDQPLYPGYGDGPLAWGLTLVGDQTLGGIVMKIGGGFYLLALILAIWIRYNRHEREWDALERELTGTRR